MEDIENDLRDIYKEAGAFFAQIPRQNDYGYKIFNSPPLHKAKVLFIGFQPGGGKESFEYETKRGAHLTWPLESEYATADWHLAVRMREMFQPALDLKNTVGLNAIFLRSPSVTDYYRDVTAKDRREVKEFCIMRVNKIIDLLEPQKIVAIGLDTLKLFGPTVPDLVNSRGNASTRLGEVAGREALGMIHLTGAHITREDRSLLAEHVLKYVTAGKSF
jgi:hypothetical protein